MMKISSDTVNVLRNFATVNSSLAVKQGSVLRTISEQKNILVQAVVNESFPVDFAVYELNQFLGFVSLFDDPDLTFHENHVQVTDENSRKGSYTYTDQTMITQPPEKNINVDDAEVKVSMDEDDYKNVVKAAHALQLPDIVISGDGESVSMTATDVKNSTSNDYSCSVGNSTAKFKMIFKTENFKFLDDDYEVVLSSKGVGYFKNVNRAVEYWVATETGSEYEE